jgi:hypothetical protein
MNQEVNTIIQGIRYAASQGVMDIASQGWNGQGGHRKCIVTDFLNLTNFVNM